MRIHLIRAFAVALVAGILPAQNQSEIDKLKKEIQSLRQQLEARDVELRKLRDKAAAAAKAQKEKAQPGAGIVLDVIPRIMFKSAVINPQWVNIGLGGRLVRALPLTNPLLRGDYRKAVVRLAKLRTKIDKVSVAAKARKVLDEMDRELIDARRALWELEKSDKKKTKPQREADRRKAAAAGRQLDNVQQWSLLVGGGRFPAKGRLRIGNEHFTYIEKGSTNPLMRGDYSAALMKVIELLRKLNATRNPKEARKRVDELSRVILEARRALWELSQAGKKQREAK